MEWIEVNYLMDKQLKGLLSKAAQILNGAASDAAIEEFYRHSAGVKRFMKYYISHTGVQKYLSQVPDMVYAAPSPNLFSRLAQILFIHLRDRRDALKQQAIEGVRHAQLIYSSIYFLHEQEAA